MTATSGNLQGYVSYQINNGELSFSDISEGIVPKICGYVACFPYSSITKTITSIKFNNGIKKVFKGACESLYYCTTVTFPSSINTLEDGLFANCKSIETINLPKNDYYRIENRMLIRNEDQTVIFVFNNKGGTATIPSTVLSIGSYAFTSAPDLANVIIPESVVHIGYYAFNTSTFEEISIPNIKSIDTGAFSRCNLKRITLPEWIDTINGSLFYGCENLTKVVAFSLREIKASAFYGCTSLNDFMYIGRSSPFNKSQCFNKCNNLRAIKITNIYRSDSFCSLPIVKIRTCVCKKYSIRNELSLITFLLL